MSARRCATAHAVAIPFRSRDFRATEAAGALNANALGAHARRAANGFLHRPAESHAPLELQCNVLGYQLGIDIGAAHFMDIDERLAARELSELRLQLLDLCALLADDDTGRAV
jgi:hypothetical protein